MPQSVTPKRLTKSYHSRSYHVGTQKYREIKTLLISFLNRTTESLQNALQMLRNRYKKIVVSRKLVRGLWTGTVEVTL